MKLARRRACATAGRAERSRCTIFLHSGDGSAHHSGGSAALRGRSARRVRRVALAQRVHPPPSVRRPLTLRFGVLNHKRGGWRPGCRAAGATALYAPDLVDEMTFFSSLAFQTPPSRRLSRLKTRARFHGAAFFVRSSPKQGSSMRR